MSDDVFFQDYSQWKSDLEDFGYEHACIIIYFNKDKCDFPEKYKRYIEEVIGDKHYEFVTNLDELKDLLNKVYNKVVVLAYDPSPREKGSIKHMLRSYNRKTTYDTAYISLSENDTIIYQTPITQYNSIKKLEEMITDYL